MAQNLINLDIPETLSPYLDTLKDGNTIDVKVTISIVVGLFVSGIITLEKAAELAKESIWEFIDFLKAHDIPWGNYSQDELKMDEFSIARLLGEENE